jgi:amino acid transporter
MITTITTTVIIIIIIIIIVLLIPSKAGKVSWNFVTLLPSFLRCRASSMIDCFSHACSGDTSCIACTASKVNVPDLPRGEIALFFTDD